MCTVTFVPKNKYEFTLTSNRDENVNRAVALSPQFSNLENTKVIFPKDQKGGGTWVGVTEKKRTLCLLNGAFIKHTPTGNYKKSRGLVVLDFFNTTNSKQLLNDYNFKNIEPFTLIIIEHTNQTELTVLKWDGVKKHITVLDASKFHIWSSSTLYNSKEATYKEHCFLELIKSTSSNLDILNFHENGIKSNPSLLLYNNNESPIETISITQINCTKENSLMLYKDLKNNIIFEKQFNFSLVDV